MFHIVVGIDQNRGIGKSGVLPWPKLKGDMKFYRELTTCPITDRIDERYKLVITDEQEEFYDMDRDPNELSPLEPSALTQAQAASYQRLSGQLHQLMP